MTVYTRPDEVIFASGAKQGEIVTFPDLIRGWGVTIDTTNGIPPMEFFNFTGNRLDKAINYLLQTGVPEHSATTEYPKGAIVQSAGQLYIALQQNTAKEPQWDTTSWENLTPPATTSKAGIVALSNDTASTHEDIAATSLAVKTVFDLAQKAITLVNTKTSQEDFDKLLDSFVGVPLPWHSMTVPDGFIAMNGDRFNTVAYPRLARIYPSGRTPDARGRVIRGVGGLAAPILEMQDDCIEDHFHLLYTEGSNLFHNGETFAVLADNSSNLNTAGCFYSKDRFNFAFTSDGVKAKTALVSESENAKTNMETRVKSVSYNFICLAR